MACTRCTCIRDEDLTLLAADPACPAPSHLWDAVEAAIPD